MIKNNYPCVSIIILNYNSKKYLKDCLDSLSNINYPREKYEVILADNASADDSVKWVQENYPWVITVEFDENYGYAGGNNKAVDSAKYEYVLFLNPDTVVDENWLTGLVNCMQSNEKIAVCGSKIIFLEDKTTLQCAGMIMTPVGGDHVIGLGEEDTEIYNIPKYVHSVMGCSFLVRKEIFTLLDGFDVDYFAFGEESDFTHRVWLYGYKVAYVPKSVVYHELGGNFGREESPLRTFYSTRNVLFTAVKNFEMCMMVKALALSCLYYSYNCITYSIKGNHSNVLAVFRAYYGFIKGLPKCVEKRKTIQKNRIIADKDLYNLNLIISVKKSIIVAITK